MTKTAIALVAVITAYSIFAQPPARNKLSRAIKSAPSQELARRMFDRENPAGTNKFNRSFEQQMYYETNLVLKSFAGFEFGKRMDGASALANGAVALIDPDEYLKSHVKVVKLERSIRHFTHARLAYSFNRKLLCEVSLYAPVTGVSREQIDEEAETMKDILEEKYQLSFHRFANEVLGGKWQFESDKLSIRMVTKGANPYNGISMSVLQKKADGDLYLCVKVKNKTIDDTPENKVEWTLSPDEDADRF